MAGVFDIELSDAQQHNTADSKVEHEKVSDDEYIDIEEVSL